MLDTRSKIVSAETARERLAGRPLVVAYFDPMVASHTRRLHELACQLGRLAICICDPPDPLLPARARAELAAACRDVEFVFLGEGALPHASSIIDEREGDLERRGALMRLVRSRQNG
ncbi:MAG: hypothetical protein HYX27_05765 [Acidobacteria bacterium]|nr:hypothetical protein [Acidobacteriota bacterium]